MPEIGDLLSVRDRQRLEESLWQQGKPELIAAARDAARESAGAGSLAWLCVAIAVETSESAAEALAAVDEMTQPGELRDLARASLELLEKNTTRTGRTDLAMPGQKPAPGLAGHHLIANVERLRTERGLSLNRLSALLEEAGRPVPPLGLSRMTKAERRIDVDELVALAEVLGVTPDVLLAAPGTGKPTSDHAAVRAAQDLAARIGQLLEADGNPATREDLSGSVDRARRRVQIEIEELLAEMRKP